ncbi:MAG: hypothetical protein IJX90_12595 [Blautia sp.]|nr:hypothetical protein [Blautia sp.]
MMKRIFAAALAATMVMGCASMAAAEEATWPNGDVDFYCGYAVGSLTDVNVHTIADWITEKTGATVKIENNDVGGGANLATKLVAAEPDGQTMMLVGMNCISNYYSDLWTVNPANPEEFKIVCGFIEPWPDSGCMIMTQADAPYSNWEELAAYAEEHPGEVTVASIPGKVMDIKMKAIFNGTGLSDKIRWVSTNNQDAAAGLLGGTINCIMLDEYTALSYIRDGSSKALINSRVSDDFSMYEDADREELEKVQTLVDAFGEEGAAMAVPNSSAVVVPVDTPDEICEQIRTIIDSIDAETEGEWYDRCRTNGGTSKYYASEPDELAAEWARLDPIIKEICEMD